MSRALLAVISFVSACNSASPPSHDMSADLAPAGIAIAATNGTVALQASDIGITGAGSSVVGAISFTSGAGTAVLDGKSVPLAVYEKQDWSSQGYVLYQALAVEPTRIWVLWFYCDAQSHALTNVYYEATDGTVVTTETASGTCQDSDTTTNVAVAFPAVQLPAPPLLPGFTISGAKLTLDGASPGQLTLGPTTYALYVFNTVDCTTTCGSPGWTELHSLIWDAANARLCFAIVYLHADDTTHVQLSYSLTLPTLTEPAGNTLLAADWTIP